MRINFYSFFVFFLFMGMTTLVNAQNDKNEYDKKLSLAKSFLEKQSEQVKIENEEAENGKRNRNLSPFDKEVFQEMILAGSRASQKALSSTENIQESDKQAAHRNVMKAAFLDANIRAFAKSFSVSELQELINLHDRPVMNKLFSLNKRFVDAFMGGSIGVMFGIGLDGQGGISEDEQK